MKKTFLALTALAGAGLVAAPAAAAEAEAKPRISVSVGVGNGYGYGQPYYRGYDRYDRRYDNRGYYGRQHFAYGKARQLQRRVGQMRQDIYYFGQRGALSRGEYRNLMRRADRLERRIDRMAYRGLNRNEYRRALNGVRNLRQAIQRDLRDGRRYAGYGYGYRGDRDRYWRDDDRYYNDRRWNDRRWNQRRDRDDDDDDWDD